MPCMTYDLLVKVRPWEFEGSAGSGMVLTRLTSFWEIRGDYSSFLWGKRDVGSETTYDMGLWGVDSADCFRTCVPYHGVGEGTGREERG